MAEATGTCKYGVIRVDGHFLSSLFSRLSSVGLRLRPFDPALTAEQIDLIFTMDSVAPTRIASFLQVVLPRRGGLEIGRPPKRDPFLDL